MHFFNRRTFYNLRSKIYTSEHFSFFFFSLFSIIIICNYFYAIRTFSGIVTITRELLEIKVSLICAGMFCSLYNRHTYTKKKKNGNAILHAYAGLRIQHDRHANFVDALMCCLRWWWEKCHNG